MAGFTPSATGAETSSEIGARLFFTSGVPRICSAALIVSVLLVKRKV